VARHIRLSSLLLAFDQRPVKQIEQLNRLANERLIRTQAQGNRKKTFALNLAKRWGMAGNDRQ